MVAYPIIITSYVRNSVDETLLDRVAFLRELFMIRDRSFSLSGLLSCDVLIELRYLARLHELVGFLVCFFSYYIRW